MSSTISLDWRKFGHNRLVKMTKTYIMFRFGYRWALKIDRGCPQFDQIKKLTESFYGESVKIKFRGPTAKELEELIWCCQDHSAYHHNVLYFKQREDLDRVIGYYAMSH